MKMTQFANFANNATKQILGTSGLIRENLQSMFTYPEAINVLDAVTVSGDVIVIDDAAPLNAKRITVYIKPLQEGSGNPSPENIRIINGWTGVNINLNGVINPITFPVNVGTVYGGTFNVTNGVLIVDRAFITIGDCVWSAVSNYTYTQLFGSRSVMQLIDKSIDTVNQARGLYSSKFRPVGRSYQYTHRNDANSVDTIAITTTGELYIASSGSSTYENATEFKNALSNTQIVYPLAEPQIYQIEPTDILMNNGNNTIFADCGSMELEYYRREGGGNPYV